MQIRLLTWLSILALSFGCSFHSTATSWNGRVGPNGKPVYVKTTTNVGFNLLILLRLIGSTDLHHMIDEVTREIAREGGDRVRVIESSSENYWYGFPPFTWGLTPVITTVAAEYQPSRRRLIDDRIQREIDELD